MTGVELKDALVLELGRPADDDLFDPADDGAQYYAALTVALDELRRRIVMHAPDILRQDATITTVDGGASYALTGYHLGEIEVYTPPGVRTGRQLFPGRPGTASHRFWIEHPAGAFPKIYLTTPKSYTPGLYIRWVPAATTAITSSSTDSGLPPYCDRYLILRAAADLARRPGAGLEYGYYEQLATEEWAGKRTDPSDVGLIGILKRRRAHEDLASLDLEVGPWWHGLR